MPDSMLILVIMGIGVAIIVGMSARKGIGLIVSIVAMIVLAPFIERLISALPLWITLLLLASLGIQLLRNVLQFAFGREAAGHILGTLVVGAARFAIQAGLYPLRMLGRGVGKAIHHFR